MKTKADRRRFLKNLGMGGVGAGLLSAEMSCAPNERKGIAENNKPIGERSTRAYNGKYSDDYLSRIAMPIGGMGAGMFCLEGAGAISHVSAGHVCRHCY